jgi:hypothetical protein
MPEPVWIKGTAEGTDIAMGRCAQETDWRDELIFWS